MVKTPFAKSGDNSIVFATTAQRKRKYVCVECSSPVVVRRGVKKVPHFTHLAQAACHGESHVHRSTKEWIKSVVTRPEFQVTCACSSCLKTFPLIKGNADLKAVVECKALSFVVDVALFAKGKVAGFIEVYYTHRTSAEKRKQLESIAGWHCPVAEIQAVDLVRENFPLTFASINPRRCKTCLQKAIQEKVFPK